MHKAILLSLAAVANAATNISLPAIPAQPPADASQVLDRRLASLSIEFAHLPTFAGNKSHPNRLTGEIMKRIVERTGLGPDVRSGGITIDSSVFDENAPALNLTLSDSLQIYRTTYGPAYFESYGIFPDTSRFILNVNLKNDSIEIAQKQIEAGLKYLDKERVYSILLGNEPDLYQPKWTSAEYTAKFLNWTSTFTKALDLPPRIFQAGGFAKLPRTTAPMTTVSTINDGIDQTGVVKLFDQHTYKFSTCTPESNAQATLQALVNHTGITSHWDQWKPQIAAAQSLGKEFVMGEYGSVSCFGKQNVSDTFGQAMWLSDVLLYGASLNISRMYLHQGATLVGSGPGQANGPGLSWYDLWYPVPSDRYGAARVSPSFIAYLLVTEAVGSSDQTRLALVRDTSFPPTFVVYAIWDPSACGDGVARAVLLNMALRWEGSVVDEADTVAVDVSRWVRSGREAKVKRMSATGVDSKDVEGVTWAGQSYTDGVPVGKLDVESLEAGRDQAWQVWRGRKGGQAITAPVVAQHVTADLVASVQCAQFSDPNPDRTCLSDLEEDSPYSEVCSVVANANNPDVPASTVCAWILGTIWAIFLPSLNRFFFLHYPSVTTGNPVAHLIGFSIGGITHRFLVAPPSMIWLANLVYSALFNTLQASTCGSISCERFFL